MQSGFAEPEKFCFEHYNFIPDIVCCGKGMGSGLPISGIITSKNYVNSKCKFTIYTLKESISCAAGSATLDEIKRLDLVNKTSIKGKILKNIWIISTKNIQI